MSYIRHPNRCINKHSPLRKKFNGKAINCYWDGCDWIEGSWMKYRQQRYQLWIKDYLQYEDNQPDSGN